MVAYPGVNYDEEVPLLLSEIDPVQNTAVNQAVHTSGFSETAVWNGQTGQCGDPAIHSCYPPAVNYSPRYYLINGRSFDKASPTVRPAPSGNVLLRFVNAGLRTHIPSVVGLSMSLIAEDGNVLPGIPRVQNEVLLVAGKTYDVMVHPPSAPAAYAVFDRQLSLSTNNQSDGGMLAYLRVNGGVLPAAVTNIIYGGTSTAGNASAVNDTYNAVISGQTLTVSDPAKGVMANDVNIYGVKVVGAVPGGLVLNPDGTFIYSGGVAGTSFTYCGNGATTGPACALVTLGAATIENASGITCNVPIPTYTSNVATSLSIKPPGVLSFCKDAAGYPLRVAGASFSGFTLSINPDGSFNATGSPGSHTFTFTPQNSQGTNGSPATATLVFPTPSGLSVTLVDGITKAALDPQDYRWIIEEDRTFFVDPNCQKNPVPAGCPTVTPQGAPAVFGTNFHTSYMPVVAQGCVGSISCESGQTMLDPVSGEHVNAVCDIGNGVCRPDAIGQKMAVDPSQVVLDPTKHYYISVLPGDAMDPGHAMGGAQIAPGQTSVTVIVEPQNAAGGQTLGVCVRGRPSAQR